MKPSSKHKRKREEIEEVKDEEQLLKRDKQAFLLEVKKLKHNASSSMEGTQSMGKVSTGFEKLNLFSQPETDSKQEPL